MPGNTFGQLFRITTFGESHGPAVGVVVDGCPSGLKLEAADIQKELDRRKPKQASLTSGRNENEPIEILSGVFEGKTTGTPISLMLRNVDAHSSDYENIKDLFRPGHADFTYFKKYGLRDYRGGGRSSGREAIGRIAAGAIAKLLIAKEGIRVYAYSKQIGRISAKKIVLEDIEKNNVKSADTLVAAEMEKEILKAKSEGDSVGGIVEIIVKGCPPGLGDPVFDKLEADLAKALMSIGAVRGIEIGKGFEVACMRGSENNDQINATGFLSNNAGGILGGISTGQDIVLRIAVKPTPSIAKEQKTVDIKNKPAKIKIEGRHDPCIVPKMVAIAESMVALVIADKLLLQRCVKL